MHLQDDEPLENIRVAEKHVRFLWRWILMPLLFCLLGTLINFNTLSTTTIKKAVGLIVAGTQPCWPLLWTPTSALGFRLGFTCLRIFEHSIRQQCYVMHCFVTVGLLTQLPIVHILKGG